MDLVFSVLYSAKYSIMGKNGYGIAFFGVGGVVIVIKKVDLKSSPYLVSSNKL